MQDIDVRKALIGVWLVLACGALSSSERRDRGQPGGGAIPIALGGASAGGGASGGAPNAGTAGAVGTAGNNGGSGNGGETGGRPGSGGQGGASIPGQAPSAFRISNTTNETVYINASLLVQCRQGGATGTESCQFFPYGCRFACGEAEPASDCCLSCEPETPRVLRLDPGQSEVVTWDGTLSSLNATHCSACDCQERNAIVEGQYRAVVQAYSAYVCDFEACDADAGEIVGARVDGNPGDHGADFTIPGMLDEVVIEITGS